MSDSFVTQCPHCQTSFRVNHSQLSMARGVVRCGACLQVFNAAQQLLNKSAEKEQQPVVAAPAAEPRPIESPAAPEPISQKQWQAAELDLDHLDLDKELARLEELEIQPSKSFGQPSATRQDTLSARRDSDEGEERQWSDSLFSDSAAERAEAIEAEPERLEPADSGRTEPSLSLDLDDPDDTPASAVAG